MVIKQHLVLVKGKIAMNILFHMVGYGKLVVLLAHGNKT